MIDDTLLWATRAFVYQHFATTTRAPSADEISQNFGVGVAQAIELLTTLDKKHALFLEPGTLNIRMANPFSGVPTQFEVDIEGKTYWANCAWDCFGIVAALHANEATLRAQCTHSGEALHLKFTNRQPEPADWRVHFQVPFRHWYDDLVHT
ncbi:MAG: organomercurial lyase [Anaerolineales bacterium]